MKRLLLLTFSLFISQSTRAEIGFEDAAYPEYVTSGRAMALGNAYVARVDDAAAAFYNPAGLGTVRKAHLHLSNLHIEMNKGWMDARSGESFTDIPSNIADGLSIEGMRNLLNQNRGVVSNSRLQFMPNFTARYFSLGYMYSHQTRGTIGVESNAQYEYASRRDHGPYAALNVSLFGGVMKFGVTGVYLTRKEVFGEADPDQAITVTDQDYKKGRALLFTSGFKLTLPVAALPTFAVKMNNATSKSFSASDGYGGAPNEVRQSIDVGFSLSPNIGKTTRVHLELNYKDATEKYDVKSKRRIGAGVELDFRRVFFVRAGYGDGYGSGGLGVRTRKLEFDLTTYAVDTTSDEFRGEEDRRFALTISSGF